MLPLFASTRLAFLLIGVCLRKLVVNSDFIKLYLRRIKIKKPRISKKVYSKNTLKFTQFIE